MLLRRLSDCLLYLVGGFQCKGDMVMGGNNLSDYRRKKDLSLREAANAAGVAPSELSSWEHERSIPSDEQLDALAALYGCTAAELRATLPDPVKVSESKAKAERFLSAVSAIHQHARAAGLRKGNGGRNRMPCPICGADLGYSVASVNGHIWAACKTDGCVRFMQ